MVTFLSSGRGQGGMLIFVDGMKNESLMTTKCPEIIHVRCIPGAKWTEQQVMSMTNKQNECISRSSGVIEWFREELHVFLKTQNLKSGLKKNNLNVCLKFV